MYDDEERGSWLTVINDQVVKKSDGNFNRTSDVLFQNLLINFFRPLAQFLMK